MFLTKNDFKKDTFISFIFLFKVITLRIRIIFWSLINKISLKMVNIKFGKGCRFLGWSLIKRYPQSIIKIGNNCLFNSVVDFNLIGVNRPCTISTQDRNAQLIIGDNCGFSGASISSFLYIKIGNNVRVGANVLITDSDWHSDDYRSGENKPVIIHNNVWLGVNSVILKGVTIGENSVVGANSVVTKDIPSNVIAAGNPCKVIKAINKIF
jgi:acetyltransferase-like isoleucine patch superfamily enzyme